MAGFTESGITLNFPTDSWFRFEASKPYSDISGFSFKEMDACWLDDEHRVFYAIELKEYTAAGSLSAENAQTRKWEIVKKSVDAMQMLLSAKYQNAFGIRLEEEKGVDLHSAPLTFKFITIVRVSEESQGYMGAFKDSCRICFQGYASVWEGISFTVLTYEQAKRHLPFVF